MLARADMCEILATKLLNRFSSNRIQLASVLMTSWNPLSGASEPVFEEVKMLLGGDDDCMNNPQCALEVSFLVVSGRFGGCNLWERAYSYAFR
jgi:hypothetical protein